MLYSHSGCGVCTGGFTLDVTVLNHMLEHRVGLVLRIFFGDCAMFPAVLKQGRSQSGSALYIRFGYAVLTGPCWTFQCLKLGKPP